MTAFDTIYPADSLEFCPHPCAQGIFVCGTYKLDEPTNTNGATSSLQDLETEQPQQRKQRRRGKCLVFESLSEDIVETVPQLQVTIYLLSNLSLLQCLYIANKYKRFHCLRFPI